VSTDDEPPEERAFDYARTVALSDGVFAIGLTLLVLNITVPVLGTGHHDQLGSRLLGDRSQFESYALSFAIIALLWVRHHTLFRGLDRIDGKLTALNLAYLAFIAFLPYPTRVLGQYSSDTAAAVLYAVTLLCLTGIAALTRVHATRAGLLSEDGRRELARREHWALGPLILLASIPIAFLSPAAAEYVWLLLLVPVTRVPHHLGRR
jgi:uncharacterized membrane protein